MYLGGVYCAERGVQREGGGTSKSTGRSERVESSRGGDDGPADIQKTKGQNQNQNHNQNNVYLVCRYRYNVKVI